MYDQGVLKEGTSTVYTAMTSLPSANLNSTYEQFKGYLDVPSFIDYMLLHFYLGHQDWGLNKNWSALRQRAGGTFTTEGKFRYIPWDAENVLLNTTVSRVPNAGGSTDVPSGLHTKLDNNAQYRLDFADRAHRHLIAPGGSLTQARNTARWQKWQTVLDNPIVAESCRWGDYRRDVHPYLEGTYPLYTRESQWLAECSRIVNTYFPARATIILEQLRTASLYPTLNAPGVHRRGRRQRRRIGPGDTRLSARHGPARRRFRHHQRGHDLLHHRWQRPARDLRRHARSRGANLHHAAHHQRRHPRQGTRSPRRAPGARSTRRSSPPTPRCLRLESPS